jgi:hypothetical protein
MPIPYGILLGFQNTRSVELFDIHTRMDVGLISKVSLLILTRILGVPSSPHLHVPAAVKLKRLLIFTVSRTHHSALSM